MEDHLHGADGRVIIDGPAIAEAPVAEVIETETVAGADVEIAKIEASRDVQLAKTEVARAEVLGAEEAAELRGEVRALREIVESLKPPEPEPTPPIIMDAPEPEPTEPVPPIVEQRPPEPKKSKSLSWFG